jgi:hypothetical protein
MKFPAFFRCRLPIWLTRLVLLFAVNAPFLRAESSALLYAETITVTQSGPLEFTFRDEGTGATNYVAEFSDAIGDGAFWTQDSTAVFSSLGAGSFRVHVADPVKPNGFYRVVALRPAAGPVVANFAATQFQVTEGGTISVLISFSALYTGQLRYTVSGTASIEDFQPLSGEVFVNNSLTAVIPIVLTENSTLSELKYLSIRLESGPGLEIGSSAETQLSIDENDAEWQGAMSFGTTALGFVLSIEKTANGTNARIRSDPAGIFPREPISSTLVLTESLFAFTATNIPLAAESNLFKTSVALSLQLNAENGVLNQAVSSNSVEGVAILVTQFQGRSYLNRTNQGTFTLYKPPVNPSAQSVELVQLP